MIAPLRQIDPESTPVSRQLRQARRFIATTFLQGDSQPAGPSRRIPAWRAWLLAGWVVVVTITYFVSMLAPLLG